MTLAELFDRAAQRYDTTRRQLVPCFDDFYGVTLDLLPGDHALPLRVLDLGAGTGLLSAMIAHAFPRAHLTLVDISADMLARAAERLAPLHDRVTLRRLDYSSADLGGPFDAVVSALSIHHLSHADKRALFGRIHTALVPGGLFVNADQALGPSPRIEARYHAAWLHAVRERGIAEPDLAAALERIRADHNAPLDAQLGWLREAGFHEVSCWYQWYRFVVYAGLR